MPANLKRWGRGISETTQVILPRREPSRDDRSLETLTKAAEAMRTVGLIYHSPQHDPIARRIAPYGLVFQQGRWYTVGFCHLRSAMRSFRLDRISGVHLLDATFIRNAHFDAADFMSESLISWGPTHEVSLVLTSIMPCPLTLRTTFSVQVRSRRLTVGYCSTPEPTASSGLPIGWHSCRFDLPFSNQMVSKRHFASTPTTYWPVASQLQHSQSIHPNTVCNL